MRFSGVILLLLVLFYGALKIIQQYKRSFSGRKETHILVIHLFDL